MGYQGPFQRGRAGLLDEYVVVCLITAGVDLNDREFEFSLDKDLKNISCCRVITKERDLLCHACNRFAVTRTVPWHIQCVFPTTN